ncbi:MAG: hypothetical protein NT015_09000 [Alphaproteobacteria bacterium]|nr:hypothetical protein [Alphaproteobacteria bacterium]
MEDFVFMLAAVSAFASAVAALTSLAQARGTVQGNEVNVYLRLMEDYNAPSMREALYALGAFWRDHQSKFSEPGVAWLEMNSSDPEKAKEVRGHARLVSNFFGSAARLYEAGFVSKRLFRLLILRPGLNVYYVIVAPINVVRSPNGETMHYLRVLKRVVPQYADGLY